MWKLEKLDNNDVELDRDIPPDGYNSYIHTAGWAKYLSAERYEPFLAQFIEGDKLVAYMIVYRKKIFKFINVWWVPDRMCGEQVLVKELIEKIIEQSGRLFYLRWRSCAKYSFSERLIYLQSGLRPAYPPLNTGWSFKVALDSFNDESLTRNWRRNYKRATTRNLTLDYDVNLQDILSVYRELRKIKSIDDIYTDAQLKNIFEANKDRIKAVKVTGPDNSLAVRAALLYKGVAIDLFAAANEAARLNYSSYYCAKHLINLCREQGAIVYDLSGFDVVNNVGVYNFKKGIGGEIYQSTGEFFISSHKLLSWLVNLFFRHKLKYYY